MEAASMPNLNYYFAMGGRSDAPPLTKHQFRLPKILARRGGTVGRPPKNIRPSFTPDQMETAIQVAMYSKIIYNWVVSEAEFVGVDLNTPDGHAFFKKNAREAALKLLK